MKLTVEVELEPEEIPIATEILRILKQVTKDVKSKNARQLFRGLISKLGDSKTPIDEITSKINILLAEGGENTVNDFMEAFNSVVFDPELVTRNQSAVPFLYLLPSIQEPFLSLIREQLIHSVIKFLTIKRPLEANRMDFFPHAEAFAALVKLEFVSVTGAVTTIITLLEKEETRSAAITMLGKTVELCLNLLNEKCDPQELIQLRMSLQNVREEIFRYDVTYINENMNWKPSSVKPTMPSSFPAKGPLTTTPPPLETIAINPAINAISQKTLFGANFSLLGSGQGKLSLVARDSLLGHTGTIFCMAYDEVRDRLISAGKDGTIFVWSQDGKQREKLTLPSHYACALDINSTMRSLYMCGVSKNGPAIISYSMNDKGNLVERGMIDKSKMKLVSCVKALTYDHGNNFVTGESFANRPLVCVYDSNSSPSFSKLQPLTTYQEHEDIITCLVQYPNHEALFLSGSRDCTIKLWDRRQAQSAGSFTSFQNNGKMTAHEGMITCLDSFDNILVSGSVDRKLMIWDLRLLDGLGKSRPLSNLSVDNVPILKVAIGPISSYAAVSTVKGLHLIDHSTGEAQAAVPFRDGKPMSMYHDLKWDPSRKILYAAGDDQRVDQFVVQL